MDTKNKHLTYDNRLDIEKYLKERLSLKQIGRNISKDCTTISKEIKNDIKITKAVSPGRQFNDCINRKHCEFRSRNTICSKDKCSSYQENINKMMSHINSYKKKVLNDCSPLQLFSTIYGKDIAIKIGITKIKNNEIILSNYLNSYFHKVHMFYHMNIYFSSFCGIYFFN